MAATTSAAPAGLRGDIDGEAAGDRVVHGVRDGERLDGDRIHGDAERVDAVVAAAEGVVGGGAGVRGRVGEVALAAVSDDDVAEGVDRRNLDGERLAAPRVRRAADAQLAEHSRRDDDPRLS